MTSLKRSFCLNFAIGSWFFIALYSVFAGLAYWSGGSFTGSQIQMIASLAAAMLAGAFITAPLNRMFRGCPPVGVAGIVCIQAYLGLLVLELFFGTAGQWGPNYLAPIFIGLYTLPYMIAIAASAVCLFSKSFKKEVRHDAL